VAITGAFAETVTGPVIVLAGNEYVFAWPDERLNDVEIVPIATVPVTVPVPGLATSIESLAHADVLSYQLK
jgi:hypothetical protein